MVDHSQGDTPSAVLKIDSANWRLIEKTYGASLTPKVRAEIVRATEAFLFFENFERTGEPLAKVKVILEAHDKAATRFFNELFASPSALSDAGFYAHHLIDNNFKASRLESDAAGLDVFLDFLRAFHIACNASIKQLNDPSVGEGNAWNSWISRLAEILAKAKSAHDDRGSDNQLVSFVWELQKCVPAECRRNQAALNEALLEAGPKHQKPTYSKSAFDQ